MVSGIRDILVPVSYTHLEQCGRRLNMGKILEIKNATKRFGGLVANEAVTFDVEEGEIVGVVGPNGAG